MAAGLALGSQLPRGGGRQGPPLHFNKRQSANSRHRDRDTVTRQVIDSAALAA